MATEEVRHTPSEQQVRQLLSTVKRTAPMMETITPSWLITFLSWLFEPGLRGEVSPLFQLFKKL
jgi:hypothetical protein